MTEQLRVGGNSIPVNGGYTDIYPTKDSLPRISSMDFMDHHIDNEGYSLRTLSLYCGYSEIAGFPVDDYYSPAVEDDTLLHFKVHGFTYNNIEDRECEDNEGHVKGYDDARIILLVLKGGILPIASDTNSEVNEYQKDEDILLTPYQLMQLIDTYYTQKHIRSSIYGMRLFR